MDFDPRLITEAATIAAMKVAIQTLIATHPDKELFIRELRSGSEGAYDFLQSTLPDSEMRAKEFMQRAFDATMSRFFAAAHRP
jgi:hypothetical protein